jgi:hypothetical protein
VSNPPNERSVLLTTRDLFFRAKLEALVELSGYTAVRSGPAPYAVVELGAVTLEQVRELVAAGTRVVAFGSHVGAQALRDAREAGAEAVPNSQVEATVRRMLGRE